MERVMMKELALFEGSEKRRSDRVGMRLPVVVYSHIDESVASLFFTENISKDGAFLLSAKDKFVVGQRVYIEISFPLSLVLRKIRLIGKIVRRQAGMTRSGYGVFFERLFERDHDFLANYLASFRNLN